ncbi:cell division protein FtsZ [[Mycoplasma] falconis]|uniref:Cell division protein FtsZ n=1 Tax=[Mycoplasma] falconis TaxID=92403 RepID=A0A501X9P4_9BACT|nr:cell division protein FtsZ [[Mycoplasma] falconis]TPE57149.1 cell division protein FtsZ [[Mycoplasma] falconis]
MDPTLNQNDDYMPVANIKVIGVGGCGNNSVKSLLGLNLEGVEIIAANTDLQALNAFDKKYRLFLGDGRGFGAGANPQVGFNAATASEKRIKETLKETDLVILSAGMGGGTGTGATPVIAKLAKEQGALVVAVITTPFNAEGKKRQQNAIEGIAQLKKYVDSYIVVSNDKLIQHYGDAGYKDALRYSDNVLKQVTRLIINIIAIPAYINVDFADLETVIKNKGEAIAGIGVASGEDRAKKATMLAISSPILESSIANASDAIVFINASDKVHMKEFEEVSALIEKQANNKNINIIFGMGESRSEESNKLGEICVSVIATGLKNEEAKPEETNKPISSSNHKVMGATTELLVSSNDFTYYDEDKNKNNSIDDLLIMKS